MYLHFVWATYRRMPLVVEEIERAVYACILEEARKAGCEVLAIGGMPDHVHVAVHAPATVAPAVLARQMKGVSSTLVRREVRPGDTFGWQDGYGVFSFSRSHRDRVVAYIRNQKRHHLEASTWGEWEPADAPARG